MPEKGDQILMEPLLSVLPLSCALKAACHGAKQRAGDSGFDIVIWTLGLCHFILGDNP